MSWLKLKPSDRVYIIPTKFGLAYAAGTVFMILIGAAYQNNLVNLLGFFMLALMFTSMFVTNYNLKGLEISRIENIHGFAGETLPISLVVKNNSRKSKVNIEFDIRGLKKSAQYDARSEIAPASDGRLLATFTAPDRGRHVFSRIVLSTTAPFGLFYAWMVCPNKAEALIYPRRVGDRNWTESHGAHVGEHKRAAGAEDFKEHRSYYPGDNLRRVDWRAYSRGRGLLTKEFDEASQTGLHFDYHRLQGIPFETRLEQLSKWVDLALQKGQPFTISLPDRRMGPDTGLVFAHRVWSELAALPSESQTQPEKR